MAGFKILNAESGRDFNNVRSQGKWVMICTFATRPLMAVESGPEKSSQSSAS